MTTKEILQGALKLMGPNGQNWVNHSPKAQNTHCLISAMVEIGFQYPDAMAHGYEVLRQITGYNGYFSDWNDSSGRTWYDVKQAFEKAIELA